MGRAFFIAVIIAGLTFAGSTRDLKEAINDL